MTQPPSETRLARGVIIFVAIVVGLNLAVWAVRAVTRSEVVDGPVGSSFVTSGDGTAALYELYQRADLEPQRLTTGMTSRTLDPQSALLILEPGLVAVAETERLALEEFVEEGGRLIISGAFAAEVLSEVFAELPEWNFSEVSAKATPVFPGVPNPMVRSVRGTTFGGWEEPGAFLPLLVDESGVPVMIEGRRGAGSVVWLTEVSFLANRHLGDLDNAELALAITQGRQPVFNEVVHGAGESARLLPDQWHVAFWLALGAVLVALVAYGYRMGPPEEEERRLDPARIGFVESLAGILARTGSPRQALEPIRTTARRQLIGRSQTLASASDRIDNARLIELAERHGLSADQAAILVNETEEADPLEVAAAFAALQRRIKERL